MEWHKNENVQMLGEINLLLLTDVLYVLGFQQLDPSIKIIKYSI